METLVAPENTSAGPKLTHNFTFDGRAYTLFRRPKLPTAPWYIHFQKNGARYLRSLDTTVQRDAEAKAKSLIKGVKEKRWEDLAASRGKREFADLETIIALYEKAPERPAAATVANNIYCFRRLLQRATGKTNLAGISAGILDAKLVRDYKADVLAPFSDQTNPDKAAVTRAKRSANSILGQARSLFAQKILPYYADAKLKLPALDTFLNEPDFGRVGKTEYQVPDNELIRLTFRGIHKLRTSGHGHARRVNRFKAIALALGGALRKGEMAPVCWDWFKTVGDRVFIRGDKLCKNNQTIDIPFQAEVWEWLQSVKPATAKDTDYILDRRTKTDLEHLFREVSKWMRKLGWKTQKTIHEFRAYLLSKVCEQHGMLAGKAVGRHSTSQVTERSYGHHIHIKNVEVQMAQNL